MRVSDEIPWRKYFDRIFCIHYVEYKERKSCIERELQRIGIVDSGIFEWRYTYRNEFERTLAVRLKVNPQALIGSLFLETKRIIAESRHKGYRRILIIQDDAMFLKDTKDIADIVSKIPLDANVIQFDKRTDGWQPRIDKWHELVKPARVNEHYVRADGNIFWGGACYALTLKGMEILDAVMSKDLINEDNCFAQVPYYAIAIKNLCMQGEYTKSERTAQGVPPDIDKRELIVQGLRREDYQSFDSSYQGSISDIGIPWNRWFDKVYCLHYLPNKNRMPRLRTELTRLGLWGSDMLEMRNMVPQRMEEIVLAACKLNVESCNRLFEVGIGMENIRVMKEALLLGYERIMIVEDDAAFLRDKSEIIRILDAMPNGFGMVQMDKAVFPEYSHLYYDMLKEKRINDYFIDSSSNTFTLSTCNVYTRQGMEKVVAALEQRMGIIDTVSAYVKGEPAVAVKNLAVQVIYGGCNNKDFFQKVQDIHSVYKSQGIDYGDYAVPAGYEYEGIVL